MLAYRRAVVVLDVVVILRRVGGPAYAPPSSPACCRPGILRVDDLEAPISLSADLFGMIVSTSPSLPLAVRT